LSIHSVEMRNLKSRDLNYFLAQPSFTNIVEHLYGGPIKYMRLEEVRRLYGIWIEGFDSGVYTESTRGAEGT